MIKKEILVAVTLAVAALSAFYAYSPDVQIVENVGTLDMTCGYTADFANFISKNSKHSPI